MTVKPKLDKKALKEAVRLAQLALNAAETAERYPSQRRKCKYCGTNFNTPPTYNGSQMRFCTAAHRKAFDKEGEKPIEVILRRQEKHMRKICREEIRMMAAVEESQAINVLTKRLREIAREEIERAFERQREARRRPDYKATQEELEEAERIINW
jgi:hypothetical protein